MKNDLTNLRTEKNLSSLEMVDVVKRLYPKFDKSMLSKCEHGDLYGVTIQRDALRELYREYGLTVPTTKERENRKLNHQLTIRLDDTDFELITQNKKEAGFETMQDCISALIKYFNRKKKRLMSYVPDHPTIRQMELFGPDESPEPICPICGSECEDVYKRDGVIIGCDVCLTRKDAYEETECFPQHNQDF